jgi:hypothetical protein
VIRFLTAALVCLLCSKEQKDSLKLLLIASDDSLLHQAFDQYEETGDIDTLLNAHLNSSKKSFAGLPPLSASSFDFDLTQNIENELDLLSMANFSAGTPAAAPAAGENPVGFRPNNSDAFAAMDSLDALVDSTLENLPVTSIDGEIALPPDFPTDLEGMDAWLQA